MKSNSFLPSYFLYKIQLENTKPICPGEGHYPFMNEFCGSAFVKCSRKISSRQLEGTLYKCPRGFSYWSVSRRCERSEKLSNCRSTIVSSSLTSIPVEWINLGKARSLRF